MNVVLVPADMRTSAALDAPLYKGAQQGKVPQSHCNPQETTSLLPLKSSMIPVKYMMYRGQLLFIGDHVAIRGDDSQIYFAIVTDYWLILTGQKYVRLQWLLPKRAHALQIDGPPERLDPAYFSLGPLHGRMEPIECILDVFFSPQRLRRPLDSPQESTAFGQCLSDDAERSKDDSFLLDGLLSTISYTESEKKSSLCCPSLLNPTTLTPRDATAHSDSEMDVRQRGRILVKAPPTIRYSSSIMDDVEMAHLLCSMH